MVKSGNIIELNGQRYDAKTGQLISGDIKTSSSQTSNAKVSGKIINDIVRPFANSLLSTKSKKITSTQPQDKAKTGSALSKTIAVPSQTLKPRGVHQLKAHLPEKTKTLARLGVHKPGPSSAKALVRVHAPVDSAFMVIKQKSAKLSKRIDPNRLSRARSIEPSYLVRHFNPDKVSETHKTIIKPLPVRKQALDNHSLTTPQAIDAVHRLKPNQRHFEKVMQQSRSHEQALVPSKRHSHKKRRLTILIVALLVILSGGILLVRNLPGIDINLASMHAGFTAKLPSYNPTGFSLIDHIDASYDQVTLTYHTRTDSRNYSVSQQVSNWDSQTLVNFITSTGEPMQSWQNQGNTIYKYGNHLSWVSGGIWFQIINHAGLSDQQLLKIAGSM